MKFFTYNSLNFKKGLSNSTIESLVLSMKIGEEVNLYCFHLHVYLSFLSLKK